ncbi:GDSL-type esterase/lipase family protein [Maridesulfovibrio zosterae]|uniref:GDSL-type esterase/lipase family protein n=1 Tax=Maridesulfovibrio zosterae TaxID=82171 RepID=UPI00040A6693|nr:GDSL-type esterase/lipase family protein [Maridesulfovibrio zosterae]
MELVFIGDSLTLGVGDPERLGWAGRICKRIDPDGSKITAYNLGIRASSSKHISSRWKYETDKRINQKNNSMLIFSFGAADFVNGLKRKESIANAKQILKSASTFFKVAFISPPPVIDKLRDSNISELSDNLIELCQNLDIPYLNINYSLRKKTAYIADIGNGDGVHPGSIGYEIMTEIIFDFLAPLIQPNLD